MKLEVNYKKKTGKFIKMWILSNMLLSNQWVKEEIKRTEKNTARLMETEIQHTKTNGTQQKQF